MGVPPLRIDGPRVADRGQVGPEAVGRGIAVPSGEEPEPVAVGYPARRGGEEGLDDPALRITLRTRPAVGEHPACGVRHRLHPDRMGRFGLPPPAQIHLVAGVVVQVAPAGVHPGGGDPRIQVGVGFRTLLRLVGQELVGGVGAGRHRLGFVDADRLPRGGNLADAPHVVLQADGQHHVEPHLHRIVAQLQLAVPVLAFGGGQGARPEPIRSVAEPHPVRLRPRDRSPATPRRSLELPVFEKAAFAAVDAAELPPLPRLRLHGFRAVPLAVPGQTEVDRTSHRSELQQADLGGDVDPEGRVQGGEQVAGEAQIRQGGRRRTGVVVGGDVLPRLGGVFPGLVVSAPLAHAHAVAPPGAFEGDGVMGQDGRRRQRRVEHRRNQGQNRRRPNAPDHPGQSINRRPLCRVYPAGAAHRGTPSRGRGRRNRDPSPGAPPRPAR